MRTFVLLVLVVCLLLPFAMSGEKKARTGVYNNKDVIKMLVKRYMAPFQPQSRLKSLVTEAAIDKLMGEARHCHEFLRVVMADGQAHFLKDPLCSDPASRRQQHDKKKFVRLTELHLTRVAQSCKGAILFTDFVVNLRDEPTQPDNTTTAAAGVAPIFSFQTKTDFLDIPIEYSVDAHNDALRHFVLNATASEERNPARYAWDKRQQKLFWRGSQTGGMYEITNWYQFPRSKLVLLSREKPALIDAGFTAWTQVYPRARKRMIHTLGKLSTFVPMTEHYRYRYLASLDGNGWANRLPFLLATGSLVFKQDSNFSAWWYPQLKAYKHYVPLPADMNKPGVLKAIAWAMEHDAEARVIAKAGQDLVRFFLRDESAHNTYMCTLLKEYQRAQSGDITQQDGIKKAARLVEMHGTQDLIATDV